MLYLVPLLLTAASSAAETSPEASKERAEKPEFAGLALPPLQDEEEPMNEWTGTINLGAIITSGNVESTALSAAVDLAYRRENDRFSFGAWGNYAENGVATDASTDVIDRRYGMKSQYDHFLSEKTYLLANGRIEHDTIAGVHQRWIVGGGAGHQFLEEEDKTLKGELGLAYFNEMLNSSVNPPLPGGQDDDKDYLALRAAYAATYQFNEDVSAEQYGEIYPSLEDSEDINSRLDTRVKASLTESMFAQFQWVWDWDNTPASGNTPSDHRYIFSLGWSI